MGSLLLFLACGVLFGLLFRGNPKFLLWNDKITALAIYLLLFCLGLSVGINEKIIENLLVYGVESLLLCSGAIAGSVAIAYCVQHFFFRQMEQ